MLGMSVCTSNFAQPEGQLQPVPRRGDWVCSGDTGARSRHEIRILSSGSVVELEKTCQSSFFPSVSCRGLGEVRGQQQTAVLRVADH